MLNDKLLLQSPESIMFHAGREYWNSPIRTHLDLRYNNIISRLTLEEIQGIESIVFDDYLAERYIGLMKNLKSITFPDSSDYTENSLIHVIEQVREHKHLKSITFDHNFNQSIEPFRELKQLKSITFGYNFNQNIEPLGEVKQLKSITFGYIFNQSIEPLKDLPNLKAIVFVKFYSHPFTYPKSCPQISIYDGPLNKYTNFLTNFYMGFSEYLQPYSNKRPEILIVGNRYIKYMRRSEKFILENKDDNSFNKEIKLGDISIKDIDEFISGGTHIKPAKN